jgi:hypothetical protein
MLGDVAHMDDVALANYQAGLFTGNVEAGRLDPLCAALLGAPVGTPIFFSDFTLSKLRLRHGEINFPRYLHMPSILLHGFAARGRKPNLVELWWLQVRSGKCSGFFAVLKATRKAEIFVETLHAVDRKEARRLLKRAKEGARLVREQQNAAVLLALGTDHLRKKKSA